MTTKELFNKINNRQLAIKNDLDRDKLRSLLSIIRPDLPNSWFGKIGNIYFIDDDNKSWDNRTHIMPNCDIINASELLNMILIDSGTSEMFPIY